MHKEMKHKALYIILSVVILTVIMNSIDAFVKPPYLIKSIIKVLLFMAVPMAYYVLNRTDRVLLKGLFRFKWRETIPAFAIGIVCASAIFGGYLLTREYFDFSGITKSLVGDSGITEKNFLFVSLYIAFCNSFLEEFFFRGYAFLTLKQYSNRYLAYFFSAFLFAFYHVGMMLTWTHIIIFIIELVGLVIGGFIFNYLNERTETIYPSWIVHMFCNFGINLVGFMLFGII